MIEESDTLIAYFARHGHYGIDSAIEVGKVSGIGRPAIGAGDLDNDAIFGLKEHLDSETMFKHSFTVFFWSISELIEHLRRQYS